MSVRNIPLAETKICYFSTLPNELLLVITKIMPLEDRLALGDSCSACRSLVSEKDCIKACRDAGLSVIPNVSGRVMAKLLCRPRVGVCNWSTDGGEPKAKLNFSEIWSTSLAITSVLRVSLHPCFNPTKYYFLSETKSFKDITLRVAPESPEIRLADHSLYRHEYISCPPLQDLRVMIIEDEGPLVDVDESDLSFLIRVPTGVTVGHFYEALFRFFYRAPSEKMARELKSVPGVADLDFSEMFPSVLAVLDYWSSGPDETSFQERGLAVELPLYGGDLLMKVHASYADTVRDPGFLEECDFDTEWGEPRVEPENTFRKRPEAPCRDTYRLFWEEQVPTFDF